MLTSVDRCKVAFDVRHAKLRRRMELHVTLLLSLSRCYLLCALKDKLLALPAITNGSVAILHGVPVLYTAPIVRSAELSTVHAAQETTNRLIASADAAWQRLETALNNWTASVSTAAGDSEHDMPRFREAEVDVAQKDVKIVATVGPVASHEAAVELCRELQGTVCSHTDLVRAFGAGLGGCHECGWTRSEVQGDQVFLVEAMRDADTCPPNHNTSGMTLCAYSSQPSPVHCCF